MFANSVTRDGKSSYVTKLSLFGQHEFRGQYSTNQKAVFSSMNKEKSNRIFVGLNLKDVIIYGEISMEGRYSFVMNME